VKVLTKQTIPAPAFSVGLQIMFYIIQLILSFFLPSTDTFAP
jgi:hypothetical protein